MLRLFSGMDKMSRIHGQKLALVSSVSFQIVLSQNSCSNRPKMLDSLNCLNSVQTASNSVQEKFGFLLV
ncbi:hypothetical protein DAI22_01g264300 [Oryza sativa Japonica Group]|nr:hypothetical protein DAI22_01g264300 [Oryza sativa Japonica Group]